jgi:hypothetical protein
MMKEEISVSTIELTSEELESMRGGYYHCNGFEFGCDYDDHGCGEGHRRRHRFDLDCDDIRVVYNHFCL